MPFLMGKNFRFTPLKGSLLLLFLLPVFGMAQEFEFENPYTDFSVDHLGNLYTVMENTTLTKMVENDEFEIEQYDYSNRSLGEITSFDATNPMKIIVNHQDFSTLVLLDVTLRETARIFLPDLQIYSNPVAYCLANDNTVWLYDDVNVRLVRVNEKGEVLFESQNLIQDIGYTPAIDGLQSSKAYLIAHEREKGFLLFDQFGAFLKVLPIKDVESFQLVDSTLVYAKKGVVYSYPLQAFAESKLVDLPDGAEKFVLQNGKLYFLNMLGVGEMSLE